MAYIYATLNIKPLILQVSAKELIILIISPSVSKKNDCG